MTDDPDFPRLIVERVVQSVLEAEMTAHLHAEPYERSPERRGYRNGYKPRMLNTRVGTLMLQVLQDRDGTFSTQLFARYQRNEKALVLAFPSAHRARIRATNGMERLNERIKRRTRVVHISPNPAACLLLVTALCVEQSEEWLSGRRYPDESAMRPLLPLRHETDLAEAGAAATIRATRDVR